MTDGEIEKQPAGPWFVAKVDSRYKVPEKAGNYINLRGKAGVCESYEQNSFGLSWAVIHFDDGPTRKIRTCYLEPEDGSAKEIVRPETEGATDPVKEKFSGVWGTGSSGTEEIRGY